MPVPPAYPSVPAPTVHRSYGVRPALCVLIVDVHLLVSTALGRALRNAGLDAHELPVGDHDTIVTAAARHPEGVVLLEPALGVDADSRRIGAVELIAALTRQGKRVLVVTENIDRAGAAVAAGAIGAVAKSAPLESLLHTLAAVAAGLPVMTGPVRDHLLAHEHQHQQRARDRARRLERLTPREHEVLALMGTGNRAVGIAAHFVVALPTVRTQIRSVLVKLEVGSQLEAVALLFDTPPGLGGTSG